jgi:hypothetical protein
MIAADHTRLGASITVFLHASLDASFQFIKKRMVPIDPKKKERLQRNAPPAPADRFILA